MLMGLPSVFRYFLKIAYSTAYNKFARRRDFCLQLSGQFESDSHLLRLHEPEFRIIPHLVIAIGHVAVRRMAQPKLQQTIGTAGDVAQVGVTVSAETVEACTVEARFLQCWVEVSAQKVALPNRGPLGVP